MAFTEAIIKKRLIAMVAYDLRKGKIIRQYNSIKTATIIPITPPH